MIRAVRPLVALTLLAAASPSLAFVRETTTGSPNSGLCTWWGARRVNFEVNASGVTETGCGTAAAAEAATAAAMATWGAAGTCADFAFEPAAPATTSALTIGNDGVNRIIFRKGLCATGESPSTHNCWSYGDTATIALTTTTKDARTGQIYDSDMELYAWDGTHGKNLTCGTTAEGLDIQAVVTHEAGHMLGLGHPCDQFDCATPRPVMAATIGAQRLLAPDDVAGICAIYPKGSATSTCVPPDEDSGGGCASGGGAGTAALLVALLPLARLRRRPTRR